MRKAASSVLVVIRQNSRQSHLTGVQHKWTTISVRKETNTQRGWRRRIRTLGESILPTGIHSSNSSFWRQKHFLKIPETEREPFQHTITNIYLRPSHEMVRISFYINKTLTVPSLLQRKQTTFSRVIHHVLQLWLSNLTELQSFTV